MCSPMDLESGIVIRAVGRRMSGCGRGSTNSLDGGMVVNGLHQGHFGIRVHTTVEVT